jgi:hypothetical protein
VPHKPQVTSGSTSQARDAAYPSIAEIEVLRIEVGDCATRRRFKGTAVCFVSREASLIQGRDLASPLLRDSRSPRFYDVMTALV